jgi:hypothetical protein
MMVERLILRLSSCAGGSYLLTKGSTQAQVRLPTSASLARRAPLTPGLPLLQLLADTGASVVTKGTWLPDKSKATAADPPLYLHVVAQTKEILDKALAAVRPLPTFYARDAT